MPTEHHSKNIMPPKENKNGFQSIDKKLPEIVNHYNMNKGRVDTFDHLISLYSCRRKTNRWTMNCLYYLIDLAASNAFILFALKKISKTRHYSMNCPDRGEKVLNNWLLSWYLKK